MKNKHYKIFVEQVTNKVIKKILERLDKNHISEASGFDNIFNTLKIKLTSISMLPDNMIDTKQYKEHEIIDALKEMGYEYKKPIGNKLHFFNKKTSISLYLSQSDHKISLVP